MNDHVSAMNRLSGLLFSGASVRVASAGFALYFGYVVVGAAVRYLDAVVQVFERVN